MNRRCLLPALLIGALLCPAIGVCSGEAAPKPGNAAAGSAPRGTPTARCRQTPARVPAPMLRGDGSLLDSGMGLASLAVLAESVSILAPARDAHGLLFVPPCRPARSAQAASGGYPFAPPAAASAPAANPAADQATDQAD